MTKNDVDELIENTIGSDDDYDMFSLARDMYESKHVTLQEFTMFMMHMSQTLTECDRHNVGEFDWKSHTFRAWRGEQTEGLI